MYSKIINTHWARVLLVSIFIGTMFACSYSLGDYTPPMQQRFLVVDASLTDVNQEQKVVLSFSRLGLTNSNIQEPINNADVWIQEENGQKIPFQLKEKGIYLSAKNKGVTGKSYQLNFKLKDGRLYQSSFEKMPKPVPIDSISVETSVDTRYPLENMLRGGFDISVNLKDTKNEPQYYQWEWERYRKIFWCKTCPNGRAVSSDGDCVFANRTPSGLPRRYACRGDCYDKSSNNGYIILKDELVDGEVVKKQVLRTPYAFDQEDQPFGRFFIIVKQKSVTKTTFEWLNRNKDLVEANGTLFDVPPQSNFSGNLINLSDKEEKILGIFNVYSLVEKVKVFNMNVPIVNAKLKFLIEPGEDACNPVTFCAQPCIESETRSKIPPRGWVQ